MRAVQVLCAVFFLCLMAYVSTQYASVMSAIQPGGPTKKEPPAKPLAEAAPEVDRLRGDFRQLAEQALAQVPLCVNREHDTDPARPRGSVLIWDVGTSDVSEVHGRLPASARLQHADQPCTVYLITERERTFAMDYNHDIFRGGGATGVKGYRTDLVVCAVDLPSGQPRGRYQINGDGPPMIVTIKPGVREIDEDWQGNLKSWLDKCVSGPKPVSVHKGWQVMCRHGDEAREVIDECEILGSLPTLGRIPSKAIIYNLQTDGFHPANQYLRMRASEDAENLLMVLPLTEELVIDERRRTGRIDFRVALVSFPGPEPLGVYQVQGELWKLPAKPGVSWAPANDAHKFNPHIALARWVERVCEVKRGLPSGTIPVSTDVEPLADTAWLKGPGWLKENPHDSLPPEQQAWARMAKECSSAIAECRALGPSVPSGKLPKKAVVWMDHSQAFFLHPAQRSLPKHLQAGPKDTQVLMAMFVGTDYITEPKSKPKTERFDYEIALYTMPGAKPVGLFRIRGETLDYNRDRHAPNAKSADAVKEISAWLTRFVESPQSVAQESAL